jgi:hypothetical protein
VGFLDPKPEPVIVISVPNAPSEGDTLVIATWAIACWFPDSINNAKSDASESGLRFQWPGLIALRLSPVHVEEDIEPELPKATGNRRPPR